MEAGCVSMWTVVNDATRCASLMFEPPPAGRQPRWTDPGKWRQFGRSLCFTGTAGGNVYADQCAQAELLTGAVRDCAVEYLGNSPKP
jgi:hypothetical protein